MSKPRRLQSAFITEAEVKKVVKYLARYTGTSEEHVDFSPTENARGIFEGVLDKEAEGYEEEDPKYEEAREVVVNTGKASTSFLQRKLNIGYSRAARLMDILEERGVVGPQ
ncbi:DNA translocase FtsK, partial [candidate division KSB1 bacterium]|nr:DNA translocase FtsK [candidate division KSB1 bacterium]NIX71601.1 DNA translocase FtsK [candidate division KSB1 bacterium]